MEKFFKELLLKDLSARLPHGVKFHTVYRPDIVYELRGIFYGGSEVLITGYQITGCQRNQKNFDMFPSAVKPYLRSLTKMTEEEKLEFAAFVEGSEEYDDLTLIPDIKYVSFHDRTCWDALSDFINWLYAHHFDIHGLIGRGLAIEAPDGMYDIN